MLQAEEHHRGHAQAEQIFADWSDGPLAHLPSGSFPPTQPGSLSPPSAATCCTLPDPWPASPTPAPAAPRARLDETVRGRLRPASSRGLTSPDPVTASRWPTSPRRPPASIPGQNHRTSRATGGAISSFDLAGLKDVDGFGELAGTPGAAAEFAQDAPGLELGIGAFGGGTELGVGAVGCLL
jgi:hypothetical protein